MTEFGFGLTETLLRKTSFLLLKDEDAAHELL